MMTRLRTLLFADLRRQFVIGVVLVNALLMGLFVVDLTDRQEGILRERQREHAMALAQSIATSSAGWLAARDYSGLREIVASQGRYPELRFAMILEEDGHIVAHSNPARIDQYVLDLPREIPDGVHILRQTGALVDALAPVLVAGQPIGWVRVGIGQEGINKRLAAITQGARFEFGTAQLPYWPDVQGAPFNSIIGGAAFWAMNRGPNATRSADENRGIAEFYGFIAQPRIAAAWHTETGFLPVTRTAFEQVRATGFYTQNPGADIPIQQLLRGGGQMTGNTRGIRLGGFVEIRTIMQEEMERALQGQQTAQAAMDNSVTRGNVVLRNFERANRA